MGAFKRNLGAARRSRMGAGVALVALKRGAALWGAWRDARTGAGSCVPTADPSMVLVGTAVAALLSLNPRKGGHFGKPF